jgi:dTDP-4-amino-4,6-dideoxygalactose transaminase
MRSGRLIQGPEVAAFEQAVAEFVGVKYAVACSSGTTALHLALMAVGVGPGDQVVVPAFTFVAPANAVLMCGAKIFLQDISLKDFNWDIKAWSNPHLISCMIPVHAFGNLFDVATLYTPFYQDRIIEDAACALGSFSLKGNAAILSFHVTKIITTGEGGMVLTNDIDIAARCNNKRDQKHGHQLAYNYRMTEMQGAIGREQMKRLPWILSRRKEIAEQYDYCFDGKIKARIAPKGGNYQSYVLLLKPEADRQTIIWELEKYGIEALMATQFLGDMPHLKTDGLPNARFAGSHAMRIPIYPQMTEDEIQKVVIAVKEVVG